MRHLLSAKVYTTSPTSGGRSVGIVFLRTATDFVVLCHQQALSTCLRAQGHQPRHLAVTIVIRIEPHFNRYQTCTCRL
jgi:hypothetical protein